MADVTLSPRFTEGDKGPSQEAWQSSEALRALLWLFKSRVASRKPKTPKDRLLSEGSDRFGLLLNLCGSVFVFFCGYPF